MNDVFKVSKYFYRDNLFDATALFSRRWEYVGRNILVLFLQMRNLKQDRLSDLLKDGTAKLVGQ